MGCHSRIEPHGLAPIFIVVHIRTHMYIYRPAHMHICFPVSSLYECKSLLISELSSCPQAVELQLLSSNYGGVPFYVNLSGERVGSYHQNHSLSFILYPPLPHRPHPHAHPHFFLSQALPSKHQTCRKDLHV